MQSINVCMFLFHVYSDMRARVAQSV